MVKKVEKTVLKYKENLYPRDAVMKAAYHFIDRSYIHVDTCNSEYVIEITAKGDNNVATIALEFENEMLAQAVRYQVYLQTHTIREILMARAMSSTITGSNTELEKDEMPNGIENLDSILMDWFERNEK